MTDPLNPASNIPTRLGRLRGIQSVNDRGVRYERRWTDCGNKRCLKCTHPNDEKRSPTHGPYWYMIALDPTTRSRRTIYLGDKLDTTLYRTPEGGFDHAAHANRPRKIPTPRTPDPEPGVLDILRQPADATDRDNSSDRSHTPDPTPQALDSGPET